MNRNTLIYWIATSLLSLQLLFASFLYFTSPEVATGFEHFGFPQYFRVELGIAKIIAALVIILPMVPVRVKEWAYAGVAITFISAIIAHTSVDGVSTAVAPFVSLVILVTSYVFAHKRNVAMA